MKHLLYLSLVLGLVCLLLLPFGCSSDDDDDDDDNDDNDDDTGDDDTGDDDTGDDDTGDDDTGDDDDTGEPEQGGAGFYTSLALDDAGAAHIVHYDLIWYGGDRENMSGEFRYATNAAKGWQTEAIAGRGFWGAYTGLVVDDAGKAHASFYYDAEPAFATNQSGQWAYVEITTGGYLEDMPGSSSLILDGDGMPYVSYFDYIDQNLDLVQITGGAMPVETVAPIGFNGWHHDMGFANNEVRIAYHDSNDDKLKFARKACGLWEIQVVDESGDVGYYPSIVATQFHSYVSYYDADNGNLRWAFNEDGPWQPVTIDTEPDVGKYTSMAEDSSGHFHISYYDAQNNNLKHTVSDGGHWLREVVDTGAGKHSSLAIDGVNAVHIGYMAWDEASQTSELRYVTNASGSWVVETLE